MQLALKVGKPQGANFPSHILFSHSSHSPQRRDLIGPARPWHYPLQCYTTLGVFNAFSTLLNGIFYQVTYMATISSQRVHGLSWGFSGSDVTTSFLTQW